MHAACGLIIIYILIIEGLKLMGKK
jgi:hypothetical protein